MRKIVLLLLTLITLTSYASSRKSTSSPYRKLTKEYRYRLTLSDKNDNPFSIEHPEKFLSSKSIERRKRMGISIDEHDLPITPAYLKGISATGAHIFNCSKWNNTVQVSLSDTTSNVLAKLRALPYVKDALLVYVAPDSVEVNDVSDRLSDITDHLKVRQSADSLYGYTQHQVDQLNLPALHQLGFRGEGMTIAVIDGGFYNADAIKALSSANILGTRNFTRPGCNVYEEHSHGMMVLSCIAPNVEHSIIGTAPNASFYLLESEDTWFEYRGEEDNWCAAVEYADSLGVDVITSSLGYTHFDTPEVTLQYNWLDGQHELNSRSASLAASRGILLCNSAGNEGDSAWKKIGFPADAKDILSVGAVNNLGVNTFFSSVGHTADGRVKPDCMAMGGRTTLLGTNGEITTANGTSFSCPTLAGAVTCLLQAFPGKRPTDIINAIHQAGNNAAHPDEIFGYGIPDMMKAYEWLKNSPAGHK